MTFYSLRRIPTPNVSPVGLYFKGMIKSFIVLLSFLFAGVIYFYNVNQGVYYYSFGVLAAIIVSVFLGGFTSGKTEKGWFFGLLIGISYGLVFSLLENFLADSNLRGVYLIKLPLILAVIGAFGGGMGYRVRLTRIRYNIRRRGINN